MEIELNNKTTNGTFNDSDKENLIKVRAIISCPSGDYIKKFRNQFPRNQIELMVVAFRIFDWMSCPKCGELLNLNLEFEI